MGGSCNRIIQEVAPTDQAGGSHNGISEEVAPTGSGKRLVQNESTMTGLSTGLNTLTKRD